MILILSDEIKSHWNVYEKICGTYIITNLINDKKYVGATTNLRKRFSDYNHVKSNDHRKIYQAIEEYGTDNFKFEFVLYDEEKYHSLHEMEYYFMTVYNTLDPEYGYNESKPRKCDYSLYANKNKSKGHIGLKETTSTKKKKGNMIIAISDHMVIIADSGKLLGDYFGVSKDMIKNYIRTPSCIKGFLLYYDDIDKRKEILEKIYQRKYIRNKKYVRIAEWLNMIENESVETIYELFTKNFGELYELTYENCKDSVQLTKFKCPLISEMKEEL